MPPIKRTDAAWRLLGPRHAASAREQRAAILAAVALVAIMAWYRFRAKKSDRQP